MRPAKDESSEDKEVEPNKKSGGVRGLYKNYPQ